MSPSLPLINRPLPIPFLPKLESGRSALSFSPRPLRLGGDSFSDLIESVGDLGLGVLECDLGVRGASLRLTSPLLRLLLRLVMGGDAAGEKQPPFLWGLGPTLLLRCCLLL